MEVASHFEGKVKRAGFKVGIGRELYSSPFIWLSVETEQDKNGRWQLKDRYAKFDVSEIGYDTNRKINFLRIVDAKTGKSVYEYGMRNQKATNATETKKQETSKSEVKQKKEATKKEEEQTIVSPKAVVTTSETIPSPDVPEYLKIYRAFLSKHKIDKNAFAEMRLKAVNDKKPGITDKSFRELTNDEWVMLIAGMEDLYNSGYYKDEA